MRIIEVKAERFAGIDGVSLSLPPGLTVVSGDNESGKSSLMEFIRTGLFESRKRNRYPLPSNDDRGRIVVDTAEEGTIVVERKGRKLSNPDGGRLPAQLFSNMELATFEGIFAIGLSELEDREALTADRTRGHMGIPPGVANLSKVYEDLTKSCDDIMGVRGGSAKRGERLRDEVIALRKEIGDLEKEMSDFEVHVAELTMLKEERDHVARKQTEVRERLEWLQAVNAQRENWLRSVECEAVIADKEGARDFPENGMDDYKALITRKVSLEDNLGTLRHDLAAVMENLGGSEVDEEVLSHSDEIKDLISNVPLRQKLIEDIERSEAVLRERRGALRKEKGRIDWDDDSLESADMSRRMRDEAKRTEGRLHDLREALRVARERHRDLQDSMYTIEDGPEEDLEDTEDQRPSLRRAQSCLRDLEFQEAAPVRFPWSVVAIPASVAIVAGVAVAYATGFLTDTLTTILLVTPSIGLLIGGLRMRSSERRAHEDKEGELQRLRGEIDGIIPAEFPHDWDGLRRWEDSILLKERDRIRIGVEQRQREEAASRKAENEERLLALEEEVSSLCDRLGNEQEAWKAFLRAKGWPDTEGPELVSEMVNVVERIRDLASEVSAKEEDIDGMRQRVAALDQRMARLLTSLDMENGDFSHSAYRLGDLLERNLEDRRSAEGFQKRIVEISAAIEDLETKLSKTTERLQTLVDPYGGEEGFRRAADDLLALKEAETELGHLRRTLMASAGNPDAHARMVEDMEQFSTAEVEESLAALKEDLSSLTEERDELQRSVGDLENTVRRLSTDDRVSQKRQLLSVKEEELIGTVHEWASKRLALMMLKEATADFEREKQPEVVMRAEVYLRTMTGRDYRLLSDLERREISVVDGETRKAADMWSSGLGDQVNLSLRLALAQAMGRPEPLPLILDDILVRFDPERRRGAAKAIAEVAEEQQVLFFTCDPAVADVFREIGAEAEHLRLQDGAIRSV